ncbi:MAG: adenylate/guanylate cyclase domain-containing protein [Thainema sp.]
MTVVAKPQRQISIGLKIFGIATSLLGLLLLVVYVSSNRLRRVNEEISGMADYVIPITDLVATIDVHALEQELHFERVLKLYEIEPADGEALRHRRHIFMERQRFEERGQLVDQELAKAEALMKDAIAHAHLATNRQEWLKLEPRIEQIEQEHQDFHDHAIRLLKLYDRKPEKARAFISQLQTEEADFNREIEEILLELEAFTVEAARSGQSHQQIVQNLSLSVAMIATVFGLFYASAVTLGLVRPVRKLTHSLQNIRAGDLDTDLSISTRDEVGILAQSFRAMVAELRLKQNLQDTFGKYVDPRVVQRLVNPSDLTTAQGERQVMTVFFADVEGFDAIAATLSPSQLVKLTNQYLTLMSAPISDHAGVIDKFIGTIIMGFWGAPFTSETEHAIAACKTALAQINKLPVLREFVSQFCPDSAILDALDLHIGITTGSLVVGNMGSDSSKSYTVMGDTVNTASRLKGASKQYGVRILITQETRNQLTDEFITRELDRIQVVGKQEPIQIYQLLGSQDSITDQQHSLIETFQSGLFAYRQRDWDTAQQHFEHCLTLQPTDQPSQIYLERLYVLRESPLDEDWDGVWQLTSK